MSDLAAFEAHRARLTRLAYRMLGSVSEAEDVVQDAWLRWRRAQTQIIDDPAGWLVRTATRICLDRMRAARVRREAYRGPWLPEPLIEEMSEESLERAEAVSVAFLLALERLSPLERAVFLLHDVFGDDYGAIAEILGRNEAACRQLATRARAHVREARPRFSVSQDEAARLVAAFMAALQKNDVAALKDVLAQDAVMISDGGGKRKAALRPMVGRDEIITLLRGLAWRGSMSAANADAAFRFARINGWLGLIVELQDGLMTLAFEPGQDGRLAAIYLVRNPDKLMHVRGVAE